MEQGLGQKSAKGVPKQHLLLPLCQFGAIEPGVASEYLISALAGKGNFVVLLNQAAEVEQRRIHAIPGKSLASTALSSNWAKYSSPHSKKV